jgi:hypothetical protein
MAMKNIIKKILKEETNRKLSPKFLISTFKILDRWLEGEGHDIDEVEDDAMVYESIIGVVESTLGISDQDSIDYIVASFVLNYMTAGDWDLLKEIGLKEPQKKKWDMTKGYGMSGWATDEVKGVEGYLPSELKYADWDGGIDWERVSFDAHDYWDEETDVYEVK